MGKDNDIEILKKCVRIYPDNLSGGKPILDEYGSETVDRALKRAYQEKWTHQRLGFLLDGYMHGNMRQCGYDPVDGLTIKVFPQYE